MKTKIRFDLYKRGSGKWKYGGEVEVNSELYIWHDDFLPEIIRNQQEVVDGTLQTGGWIMVTSNLPNDGSDKCYYQLWHPELLVEHKHIKRP